jgi:hypothetical protein
LTAVVAAIAWIIVGITVVVISALSPAGWLMWSLVAAAAVVFLWTSRLKRR